MAADAKKQYEPKATKCAVSREEFIKHAKPMLIKGTMDGQEFSAVLGAGEFSTGSFGWKAGGDKATLTINGKPVKVQLSINLTVVGSKDAK